MAKQIEHTKGQVVEILNTTIGGKVVVEGKAKLIEFVGKADYPPYVETWKVRFVEDGAKGELYNRSV